jgi:hypothetical protein
MVVSLPQSNCSFCFPFDFFFGQIPLSLNSQPDRWYAGSDLPHFRTSRNYF